MHQIEISDVCVDVVRKDIKNMHLAVYPPTGRVRLAVPLRVNDEVARLFAITKLAWIKRQQRRFEQQERLPIRECQERESHYFQGQRYLLRLQDTAGAGWVALNGKYLDLHVRPSVPTAYKKQVLDAWYRCELKQLIPDMVAYWEKKMGVQVRYWGVKRMKTRWGTCHPEKGRVWLNLELAKKPVTCLEYIVVHEMVHLLERHHNERFRAHLDFYLPDWKKRRNELNQLPVSHTDWNY